MGWCIAERRGPQKCIQIVSKSYQEIVLVAHRKSVHSWSPCKDPPGNYPQNTFLGLQIVSKSYREIVSKSYRDFPQFAIENNRNSDTISIRFGGQKEAPEGPLKDPWDPCQGPPRKPPPKHLPGPPNRIEIVSRNRIEIVSRFSSVCNSRNSDTISIRFLDTISIRFGAPGRCFGGGFLGGPWQGSQGSFRGPSKASFWPPNRIEIVSGFLFSIAN